MIVIVVTVALTIRAPLGLACALSESRLALTGRRLPTLLRA
jgi:hypothetical protein